MEFGGGAYVGEISALCVARVGQPERERVVLLAGTGSELLIYKDLNLDPKEERCKSYSVFTGGVRVHGITACTGDGDEGSSTSETATAVLVFGESRLRLFRLLVLLEGQGDVLLLPSLSLPLPRFDHWVLDARLLAPDRTLAVALSDNSLALFPLHPDGRSFSFSSPTRVRSHRCLLYSMRLHGRHLASLRVAAGTIDNRVLLWTPHRPLQPARLTAHHGSIFRLAFSHHAAALLSASDDRTARLWDLTSPAHPHIPLFGHRARVWDCSVSEHLLITAGEDCTCRLWALDGTPIATLKHHSGRGIWRCLYEPSLSLLITAGFDSAIKLHHISSSSPAHLARAPLSHAFTISAPKTLKHLTLMDSKSEYVRCLQFADQNTLYVSTNNGFLYHVNTSDPKFPKWTQLVQVTGKAAIICMDVAERGVVALGDGKGNATVVKVIDQGQNGIKVDLSLTWSAEKERQLLGVFWCKSLGSSHLFTGDPRGVLKLWDIGDNFKINTHGFPSSNVALIATFEPCFGARIMCIDASSKEEILVAGDNKGNLTIFPFAGRLTMDKLSDKLQEKIPVVDRFRGAHGISSVTSVYISGSDSSNVEIRTTGSDGCICLFKYQKLDQRMEFIGMKQVKELGTIQSVYSELHDGEAGLLGNLAIGFMSADFIIWDLVNETKIIQISCGGWRRPYSYYLGAVPLQQNCFAYLKDQEIHVHRLWMAVSEKTVVPQLLHMQFHGREIHTLSFISLESKPKQKDIHFALVATGCEDGTVRLTRYSLAERRWSDSKLLGEHVGGSAVRSICFTPKTHLFGEHLHRCHSGYEMDHDYSLLISVGSKQVLTCWILNEWNGSTTFQWFSSHVPPRVNTTNKEEKHMENDWRYMAVTAFILRNSFARMSVCFTVVACSDATLILRALLLPSRLWFDVATLGQQTSPVLSLQYIVVNGHDITTNGDRYIVISGATDGSITLWDLTQSINTFMQLLVEIQPQTLIDCQTRPKTGRGSCGGRKWRSLTNYASKSSNLEEDSAHQNSNASDLPEMEPIIVFGCVHQSGVNCLHVVSCDGGCLLLSGGDDQALHCFKLRLEGPVADSDSKVRVLNTDRIASAHSSAVKGIWTDGSWVFSAGLDQRVRCWRLGQHGKLTEHAHLIISVPEPETLDAVISDRENKGYQIAVAGRGMQMVEFSYGN